MELIVFDLDGTLLDGASEISPYTRETLAMLAERGIAYTVATGRTLHGARELLKEHPGLETQLEAIPHGVRSGRKATGDELVSGVFFCMRLPGRDMEANTTGEAVWSLEAGRAQWYYVPLGEEMEVVEDLKSIREHIRADRSEGRAVLLDDETLLAARKRVLAHIRNTYQRRLSVPQGHEPDLITWMEVHAA